MLTIEQLTLAIDIHQRAYKLLGWLNQAIQAGFIPLASAHQFGSAGDAAKSWIVRHYDNLPFDCRPESGLITEFANYFGSYLETSFDLVANPGRPWASNGYCDCAFCRRLMNPRHLRPKTMASEDKKRAAKLRLRRIAFLAQGLGLIVPDSVFQVISSGANLRDAAFSAYGASLLDRMNGIADGPAILVLWREIAWRNGSPDKSFRLQAEDFIQAERRIVTALLEASLQPLSNGEQKG